MIMKKLTLYLLTISLLHSLNGVGQIKLGGINIGHNQHSFEVQQLNQIKSNYYIVHVTKNISNKDASILKSNFGIELLEYIPDGNYLVYCTIPKNLAELENYSADQWSVYSSKHKKSVQLTKNEYPAHALISENEVWLIVNTFRNKTKQQLKTSLINAGYYPTDFEHNPNNLKVGIKIKNIDQLLSNELISFAAILPPPPVAENLPGKTDHRSTYINSEHKSLRHYDGSHVNVAMGDDRIIGPHIDYKGRIDQSRTSGNDGDHGDHVAGTIMGAGNLDPYMQGMAPGAFLHVYTVWDAVNDSPQDYYSDSIRITSTSYSNGCNAGYTAAARDVDQSMRLHKSLIHVFSAGNSNGSDCGYGAGNQWGNVTGGIKVGKNVLAVANLTASENISGSSSRGPAHDGRIKPEVSAVGTNVMSTTNPNSYVSKSGTSMSCPGVSGTLAQLYQAYKENQNEEPYAGLMKAILMNTADDLGNPGPDFIYGYGRINARKAALTIEQSNFIIDSLTNGNSKTFTLNVPPGTQEVKVMLHWTDFEGVQNANTALVNNLDLSLTDSKSVSFNPWVLDHSPNTTSLNSHAIQGIDALNNAEQITINQPADGNYTITIDGTSIPMGTQRFFIIYEYSDEQLALTYPNGGEKFEPGTQQLLRWDAVDDSAPFGLEYSVDSGGTWTTISTSIPSNSNSYNWTVAGSFTDKAIIRLTRGSNADISDYPFTISAVPQNINMVWVCPDSAKFSWNTIPNINEYQVTMLGNRYMDSVAITSQNFSILKGYNFTTEQWLSVQTKINNSLGQRAIAYFHNGSTFNCPIDLDLELTKIKYPSTGQMAECINDTAGQVTVVIKNTGLNTLNSATLQYQINSSPVVSENYNSPIQPGDSVVYLFSVFEDFSSQGNYNIEVVTTTLNDGNLYNDSSNISLNVVAGNLSSLPLSEDMESFANCNTATDCEATSCILGNGWSNGQNGDVDDIDWRTNSGATPSGITGPSVDHTLGNTSGKYLYLEASGGCNFREAKLYSPCIDIPLGTPVQLEFWYHTFGSNIGSIRVDIIKQGEYIDNFIVPITGDKGDIWNKQTANLSGFAGQTIQIVIKGITGGDFQGDISIDDINIAPINQAPLADFSTSANVTCVNTAVQLTDISTNGPSSWKWAITPNTFVYLSGTDSTSTNPIVDFTAKGYYNIALDVTNTFGNSTKYKNSLIFVDGGIYPPLSQDFDNTSFPPAGWVVDNQGGSHSWQLRGGVIGKDGNTSITAFLNNFHYINAGAEDGLQLPFLDLTKSTTSYLTFDVAYASNTNGNADGLRVDIYSDCGKKLNNSGYDLFGSTLQTDSASALLWNPSSGSDWRTDTIDLTPFLGQSITLSFVNINGSGNSLYLDNINIHDFSAPFADFSFDSPACENDSVTFNNTSFGSQQTVTWGFGVNADPPSANGSGPHKVLFNNAGAQSVQISTSNPFGSDSKTKTINIDKYPMAVFIFNITPEGGPISNWFVSNAQNATKVDWYVDSIYFSTGDSVLLTFPQSGKSYNVMQVASNDCGADTLTKVYSVVGVAENIKNSTISLFPNPANDLISFESEYYTNQIVITTMQGKVVLSKKMNAQTGTIDISKLATGVYLVEILQGSSSTVKKLNVVR